MSAFLATHPYLFSILLIVVVGVPGYIRLEQIGTKTDETVQCVQDWADATANRTQKLSTASNERSRALDILIRSILPAQKDPNVFYVALENYIASSNEFNRIAQELPVPESPVAVCAR
jgi:hypothetical protein